MYTCCRDGIKRGHIGPNQTGKTRQRSETRKLESYCLARMTAIEHLSDGSVEVRYISTHTNHDPGIAECKHLPLPQSIKADVQQQFAAGISLERIMDSKSDHTPSETVLCIPHVYIDAYCITC